MGDVFLKGIAHMNPRYLQEKVLPELMGDGINESAKVSFSERVARKFLLLVKRIEKLFGK